MHYDQTRNLEVANGPVEGDPLLHLHAMAQGRALKIVPGEDYGLFQVAEWLRTNPVLLYDWLIDHYQELGIRPVKAPEWAGKYKLTGQEVEQIVKGLVTKGGPKLLDGGAPFSNEELSVLAGSGLKVTAGVARKLYGTDGQDFRIGRHRYYSYLQAKMILGHLISRTESVRESRKQATSTAMIPAKGVLRTTSPVSPPAMPGPLPVGPEELQEVERLLRRESSSPVMEELLTELRPVYMADPTIRLNELLDALLGLQQEGREVLLHVLKVARRVGSAS